MIIAQVLVENTSLPPPIVRQCQLLERGFDPTMPTAAGAHAVHRGRLPRRLANSRHKGSIDGFTRLGAVARLYAGHAPRTVARFYAGRLGRVTCFNPRRLANVFASLDWRMHDPQANPWPERLTSR